MIHGVGVDIMLIERMDSTLDVDDSFIRSTFTAAELEEMRQHVSPRTFLASRFSAKEAVFKSLDCDGDFFQMTDVEILANEHGKPFVNLYGAASKLAARAGITKVHVSISHERDQVCSFAVASCE